MFALAEETDDRLLA